MLRKLLVLTIAMVGGVSIAQAQVELTAYTGYQFGSKTGVSTYQGYGNFRIEGSQDYMFGLSVPVRPDLQVELNYTYISTQAYFEQGGIINPDSRGDLDIHYYQIGAQSPHMLNEKIDGYGLFTLGATTFAPKEEGIANQTYFSLTLGAGLKIWLSDAVGLKLQGRFLVPVTWGGLSIGCGWGGGCGTGVTAGSALFSGDLGGGLVVRLGQ